MIFRVPEVIRITCNMGSQDLPDMYAFSLRACGPRAYQANPSCPCYNSYTACIRSYVVLYAVYFQNSN